MNIGKITTKNSSLLRKVFTNPKFHLGRVLKNGIIIGVASSLFLGLFLGIVPTLVLSSLIEGIKVIRGGKGSKIDLMI